MYKLLVSILMVVTISFADRIVISGGDLGDLDHNYAYLWRVDLNSYFTLDQKEVISSCSLYISNITDFANEPNDILWINMVDPNYIHGPNSVTSYFDNQVPTNYFSVIRPQYSSTMLVGTWSDPNGAAQRDNISFNVDLNTFLSFISDNPNTTDQAGWIGFGIDGDCHYYNDGVKLVINTTNVPEPTLFSLLGLGLCGLLFVKRKK